MMQLRYDTFTLNSTIYSLHMNSFLYMKHTPSPRDEEEIDEVEEIKGLKENMETMVWTRHQSVAFIGIAYALGRKTALSGRSFR